MAAGARQAQAQGGDTNSAVILIKKSFQETHERFLTQTNNPEIAYRFARACFDIADISTSNPERANFATQGIAAGRHSLALSNSAPAHYYLGMNLGELADARHNLSSLRLTKEMEGEFLAALALDEHFDFAGPDRNLGLVYWQAPVIGSIGNRSKARQHLQAAVQLAPDFPENHLNLIEACLKWGDHAEAQRQLDELEKLWPAAQKQFTGDEWALSWADWNRRLSAVQKRLETAAKKIESPHASP